jgi:RNA polymerase sigma factor (sigma-70 family)
VTDVLDNKASCHKMEIPQELIDRCRKGDRKAENELYTKLYGFLMSICRRYIRQEEKARELLNIGFCRILMNVNKYRPEAPFIFWARRIMVNVTINEHKKDKFHYGNHSYVDDYHEDGQYAEINKAAEHFGITHISNCVEKLPPGSRQVFNLFVIDGFSHKEIAAMVGISEGTSKWHLNAAKEKLKEMLTEKKTKIKIENERAA